MPPQKKNQVVAEYAKSSCSSCNKCSKFIASNALRLGLVARAQGGFRVAQWHHVECFPMAMATGLELPDSIKGFAFLKTSDQELLKELLDGRDNKLQDMDLHQGNCLTGESKVRRRADGVENELTKTDLKKRKLSTPDGETPQPHLCISLSASDIKSKYKDANLSPKWKAFQTVIFLEKDDGLQDSSKIAAFDFDGCLANTSIKRVGADAWSLMYPSIPGKLHKLNNDGYKLVIFTNESNIERWKNKRQVAVDSKIGRLNNFIKKVKVPIQVFIACGLGKTGKSGSQAEDAFRKPKPGMWHLMEQHFNSGISVDKDQSFYVGDAAGRPNDHSDSDIQFAKAIGLKFLIPEDYFTA